MCAFPNGVRWQNTEEMLLDVLSDLAIGWVRRWLLTDVNPLHDAKLLSNRDASSSALPMCFETRTDAGSVMYMRWNVPAFYTGHIGAGTALETSFGTGLGTAVFPLKSLSVRYVVNMVTGGQLNVLHDEAGGTIDCTYLEHGRGGLFLSAILSFEPSLFRGAFAGTGDVRLPLLMRGLLRSVVSMSQRPTAALPRRANYPYRVCDNEGAHLLDCTFRAHGGEASKPLISFRIVVGGEWRLAIPAHQLREMKEWGIRDRLRRAKPLSQYLISNAQERDDNETSRKQRDGKQSAAFSTLESLTLDDSESSK